jgi:hypothetical protein
MKQIQKTETKTKNSIVIAETETKNYFKEKTLRFVDLHDEQSYF